MTASTQEGVVKCAGMLIRVEFQEEFQAKRQMTGVKSILKSDFNSFQWFLHVTLCNGTRTTLLGMLISSPPVVNDGSSLIDF